MGEGVADVACRVGGCVPKIFVKIYENTVPNNITTSSVREKLVKTDNSPTTIDSIPPFFDALAHIDH